MTQQGEDFEALMRLSLAGDGRAYARLLRESSRLLRRYLSKRLGSSGEVDDLLQEILISIHKARHTFDGKRPYMPWAYAIARFRLQDHLRLHYADHLRHAVDLAEVEEYLPQPVTKSDISYESISGEIEKLPAKQANILRMLHQDGYTAREVAERTGMKESAVKVAAHRAYKILRKILER